MLKLETERFIIAIKDQCIKTNSYGNKILKDGANPMCRSCNQHQETIAHLVSGCLELARHNKAAAYLHWAFCKYLEHQSARQKHVPSTVIENKVPTTLWDMLIQTNEEIKLNRPDIVVEDKERTCLLICSLKTTEKLSKYIDLEIKTERMSGMRTATIPVRS